MAHFAPANNDGTLALQTKTLPVEGAETIDAALERVFLVPAIGGGAAFQPIGVGRPLRVQIQHVYSGVVFDTFGATSLICTSAVKTITQTGAQARAINMLNPRVNSRTDLEFQATLQGTPLAYYSKALTVPALTFTFELNVNQIDTSVFDNFSALLSSAGGLPIFATASSYLMAASSAVKIAGNLADVIFNKQKILQVTDQVTFGLPPASDSVARQSLFVDDHDQKNFAAEVGNNYVLNPDGKLVARADGSLYAGKYPYITVAYDGTPVPQFEGFQSLAASADLVSSFFRDPGATGTAISNDLQTAVKVYNDYKYRQQALDLKNSAPAGGLVGDQKTIFDALVANIQDATFKTGLS